MAKSPQAKAIQDALRVALDLDATVFVNRDPLKRKDPKADFVADVKAGDQYFFSHGKTEEAATKGLAIRVEEFLRTRLDKCRTALNTLGT